MDIEIQQQLFKAIKTRIPEHQSAADEIARILSISPDSAYRRLRNEKPVSIDELFTLCQHFKISIDQLMNLQADTFAFSGRVIKAESFGFYEYLSNILQHMNYINTFEQKEFFYLTKDIPVFHCYHSRELAAFKYFFWMRTILHMPEFATRKVNLKEYPEELFVIGSKARDVYNQIDSSELWNLESLNSTIRQIDFYVDSQLFQSSEDAWILYDSVEKLIWHLEKQAELGYKFKHGDERMQPMGKFNFYFNEVLLLDNTMFVEANQSKITFMVHSGINFMFTRDIRFCENMHNYIQNLMRKSTLLSSGNEKERLRFFNRLKDKIQSRKHSLQ